MGRGCVGRPIQSRSFQHDSSFFFVGRIASPRRRWCHLRFRPKSSSADLRREGLTGHSSGRINVSVRLSLVLPPRPRDRRCRLPVYPSSRDVRLFPSVRYFRPGPKGSVGSSRPGTDSCHDARSSSFFRYHCHAAVTITVTTEAQPVERPHLITSRGTHTSREDSLSSIQQYHDQ